MEPVSSARGAGPEGKGFPVLAPPVPCGEVANCSVARSVAMKRRPITTRVSMSTTRFGVSCIGNRVRNLPGYARGETHRPVRLQVGWEKDGEGNPADPSQA